jgi:hypothetical protein
VLARRYYARTNTIKDQSEASQKVPLDVKG